MIDLMIRKYQREGTRLERAWKTQGMFSRGNIKPVKMIVGSIMPIIESSKAVCWELVTLEIRSPRDRQVMMNKVLYSVKSSRLPLTSTSSTKIANTTMSPKQIGRASCRAREGQYG